MLYQRHGTGDIGMGKSLIFWKVSRGVDHYPLGFLIDEVAVHPHRQRQILIQQRLRWYGFAPRRGCLPDAAQVVDVGTQPSSLADRRWCARM